MRAMHDTLRSISTGHQPLMAARSITVAGLHFPVSQHDSPHATNVHWRAEHGIRFHLGS